MQIIMISLIVLNFWLLSVSRIKAVINILVVQGFLIGFLPILHGEKEYLILGIIVISLKGIILPWLLLNLTKKTKVIVEEKPYISFSISSWLGIVFLFVAYQTSPQMISVIFLMLVGLFLMITRKKAINQVIGFLIFENGLFLLTSSFSIEIPVIMEVTILFDVLVVVLVMTRSISHMNNIFSHTDVDKLNSLKG